MPIAGSLSTDAGIRLLDAVITAVTGNQSDCEEAIAELSQFFCRHFKTGLLPFSKSAKYPSPVQRQVYTFLDAKYRQLCDFLNGGGDYPKTEAFANAIFEMVRSDPNAQLIPAVADVYIEKGIADEAISGNPQFQIAVYQKLTKAVDEKREVAISVLTREFPESVRSNEFSELFLKISKMELTDDEVIEIFDNFECVLHRVDDQLITFDFLNHQINKGPIISSMAIPFFVDVSLNRAIDVPDFYLFAFQAISPESLSYKKRAKFLDMLSRVLSPKTLQSSIPTAFAVKLSRMLLSVAPDVQLDILSLLQFLVRAHESVAELLEPRDLPLSKVDGNISECTPQTLWEVIALKNSSIGAIAEAAKTLGQRRLPPDYCSFDLKSAVEACKAKSSAEPRFNWTEKLEKNIWD